MLTKKTLATGVAATTIMFSFGAVVPSCRRRPPAISNCFGVQETVKDLNGPLTGYTVTGLMPSSDPVPYPVAGGLYEATVKADALVGTVTPAVTFFNARAENGDNYRVLADVSSLSGAPIGPGGSTTADRLVGLADLVDGELPTDPDDHRQRTRCDGCPSSIATPTRHALTISSTRWCTCARADSRSTPDMSRAS